MWGRFGFAVCGVQMVCSVFFFVGLDRPWSFACWCFQDVFFWLSFGGIFLLGFGFGVFLRKNLPILTRQEILDDFWILRILR